MSKTNITFWGGLHTIGGNIAEIRYGNDRVIFDFGLVYDPANALVNNTKKRQSTRVLDMLKLGAIPKIDGIYNEEDLQASVFQMDTPISFEASNWNTSIFISHLHLDHVGAIDTLSDQLPIYMSEDAGRLYYCLNEIGESLTKDMEITTFNYEGKIAVGDITVTPYAIDHDVIGASSFLIETPDAAVVYSGDIRMHGAHPEWNNEWMDQMSKRDIDVLLLEGTSFRPEENQKNSALCEYEQEVSGICNQILELTEGLAIFNMYHRNIDRLKQLQAAALSSNRILVFEPETAYIADQFIENGNFYIYARNEVPPTNWENALYNKYKQVSAVDINNHPGAYLLQNSFERIIDLLDFDLTNSVYLHTNGMPLGSFDPNYQSMQLFLERFGIVYKSINVSGHATQDAIRSIIDRINPSILVPWHSHHPELVIPNNDGQVVFFPKACTMYTIENNQLVEVR